MSAKMHKSTAPFIAKSLTSDWKVARVVPIPKGGDPESPANYRPISILSILSKLLEKHMHDLLIVSSLEHFLAIVRTRMGLYLREIPNLGSHLICT